MAKKTINIDLMKELCLANGVPGNEEGIRKIITREIESHVDTIEVDNMGNLIAFKKGKSSDKSVMTAAHMDEIGFMISHIDENGFGRFHTLGGFDPKTLTAQRVVVHGKQDVIGVMGVKPIHSMPPEERNKKVKLDDFFIDFGLPKEEVEKVISIGDFVTRYSEFNEMGKSLCSKSFDNRFAVFTVVEALKKIKKPAYDLYAVFTVQEELGLRGATASARAIDPDFAFGLDVTVANDIPGIKGHKKCTELGKGPAIYVKEGRAVADRRMVRFLEEVADKLKLETQREIGEGGSSDADTIQIAGRGAITGGIMLPLRYMHTVIEMANRDDIAGCVDLLAAALEKLDKFNESWD